MKKLGLIGGTGPESTVLYYQKLTGGIQKRLNRPVFPPLTIESLSVFEVLDCCERQDYAALTDYLLEGLRCLHGAGADFAALTGITPHIVFDELRAKSPLPLVSMVDTACAFAAAQGFRKIALLGTLPTMNGSFFPKPFRERGIEVVTPTEPEKAFVGRTIATELEYGLVRPESAERAAALSRRLIAQEGADAIVLGCTELPLLFDRFSLPVPKLDVMELHIAALMEEILGE